MSGPVKAWTNLTIISFYILTLTQMFYNASAEENKVNCWQHY